MNKIYKVIWSKAKNCYVVASEFAKRNGKSSSSLNKKLIAAMLAAGTVLSVSGNAWAENGQYLHGWSYEAEVVLDAPTVEEGVALGITLYRGDRNKESGRTYLSAAQAKAALGNLYDSDYHYTKVESQATAELYFCHGKVGKR